MRVALIHYWLVARRGGERVLETLAEMFPQADIFALMADPGTLSPILQGHRLQTSFLQRIPGSRRLHRHLLPLYPLAVEQFDLRDYDLVISHESGPAKGVITGARTCHICYCHTPMRYVWDLYHQYRNDGGMGPISKGLFTLATHYVRNWDLATASRVDAFIASSENAASRIRKTYRRDATVVHPPVDVERGYIAEEIEDYYLVVGQLVSYKRTDLAIEACNRLNRPLRIVGDGEQYKRLRKLAGATVQFLGYVPDDEVRKQYAHCRALLFPGEEDIGIVPVEAQSFGRPVIAYGRGGVLETVVGWQPGRAFREDCTGVFFSQPTVESLTEAVLAFESIESKFSPAFIRESVEVFGKERFQQEFRAAVERGLSEFRNPRPAKEEFSREHVGA
ncbi:MAG: glycosyltransferase [Acidobacteria bacterium]|nr:glycosyltransferase [Acidobacteriota bacterium]